MVRERGDAVRGVLNGIDADLWDPNTDPAIEAHFGLKNLQGKRECRRALQAELGPDNDDGALLVTGISRLTAQKGFDLLVTALPELLRHGVQIAIQGSGDPELEAALRNASTQNPGRVHVTIGYNDVHSVKSCQL